VADMVSRYQAGEATARVKVARSAARPPPMGQIRWVLTRQPLPSSSLLQEPARRNPWDPV